MPAGLPPRPPDSSVSAGEPSAGAGGEEEGEGGREGGSRGGGGAEGRWVACML